MAKHCFNFQLTSCIQDNFSNVWQLNASCLFACKKITRFTMNFENVLSFVFFKVVHFKSFVIRAIAERLFTDPPYHCQCEVFIYLLYAGTKRLFLTRRRFKAFIYRPGIFLPMQSVYLPTQQITTDTKFINSADHSQYA